MLISGQIHATMFCIVEIASCRTFSPAAVQLRKLVAGGEISPGGGSTRLRTRSEASRAAGTARDRWE